MDAVEEKLGEISELAQEHKQTIQEWKDEKRKEFLLKISQERPQLLHEIQCSPHADEMLDKMVAEDLFKRALRTETLSSFDVMWLRHPRFEEIYKASREKPEHQPQTGDSTGQSEEFFESVSNPCSPSALSISTRLLAASVYTKLRTSLKTSLLSAFLFPAQRSDKSYKDDCFKPTIIFNKINASWFICLTLIDSK